MTLNTLKHKLKLKKASLVSLYSFVRKQTRLNHAPIEVFIEPTNYCNLKCIICPQHTGLKRDKGFMSLESFRRVLDEVKNVKAMKVTLHFAGEPLLNKELFGMIALCKQSGLYTRLHTNATLLSQDNSCRIIESGLDEMSISFDDARKEVYESVRINASYEATLNNIKTFLETKKRLKAKKPYTILQRMILNGNNIDALAEEKYRGLFRGLPVERFYTIFMHNWAGSYRDMPEKQSNTLEKSPCLALWFRFVVSWDSKVYACCNEMNGRLQVGDLNHEGLAEIWNGQRLIELRKAMLEARYEKIEACKECDVLIRPKKTRMNILEKCFARLLTVMAGE